MHSSKTHRKSALNSSKPSSARPKPSKICTNGKLPSYSSRRYINSGHNQRLNRRNEHVRAQIRQQKNTISHSAFSGPESCSNSKFLSNSSQISISSHVQPSCGLSTYHYQPHTTSHRSTRSSFSASSKPISSSTYFQSPYLSSRRHIANNNFPQDLLSPVPQATLAENNFEPSDSSASHHHPCSNDPPSLYESSKACPHVQPSTTAATARRLEPPMDASPLFNKPVRSVLLIKKWKSRQAAQYANTIAEYCQANGIQVFTEPSCVADFASTYPTIFDLFHQIDPDFPTYLTSCFPSFHGTVLSSDSSLISQAMGAMSQIAATHQQQQEQQQQQQQQHHKKESTNDQQQQQDQPQDNDRPANFIQSLFSTPTSQSDSEPSDAPPQIPDLSQLTTDATLEQVKATVTSRSFWRDFTRDEQLFQRCLALDPRECIAFLRKFERWQSCIDAIIAVGGDGTLLHVSTLFAHETPPVLGFSCGSFGFLMPFNPDYYQLAIDKLIRGELHYQLRSRIVFQVDPKGLAARPDHYSEQAAIHGSADASPFTISQRDPNAYHLLNEVVLKHSYGLNVSAGLSDIECRINGHVLARYQGDGLIVSSPTGSTAYSLAVGGSIVHPSMSCLLLTPMAPMALSSRPLIIPSQSLITLAPVSSPVLLEGKFGRVIHPGECINITHSDFPIPVFCRRDATGDFIHDLGNRLNYARMVRFVRKGDDLENSPHGQQGTFLSKRDDDEQAEKAAAEAAAGANNLDCSQPLTISTVMSNVCHK